MVTPGKKDTDRLFSSLVLGVYEKGQLKYIGQAGTGYSVAVQEDLMKKNEAADHQVLSFP